MFGRRAALGWLAVLMCAAPCLSEPSMERHKPKGHLSGTIEQPFPDAWCWMEADGTIKFRKINEEPDRNIKHGIFTYRRSDIAYNDILYAAGPLHPGQQKLTNFPRRLW